MVVVERIAFHDFVLVEYDDLGASSLLQSELFIDVAELHEEGVSIAVTHALVVHFAFGIGERTDEFWVDIRLVSEYLLEYRIAMDVVVDVLGKTCNRVLDEALAVSGNGCGIVHVVQSK